MRKTAYAFIFLKIFVYFLLNIKCEILLIAQIFRHTDRYPILKFNSTEFEYSGKPTFQGLLNAERKGEAFYNNYPEFIESLEPKNIKNIISNVTRNLVTSYFKLKGLLSNTQHIRHINFHDIFKDNSSNSENTYKKDLTNYDLHLNFSERENNEIKINSYLNTTEIHNHTIHQHHFENIDFNETIKSFLRDEENSIRRMTKFLIENFNTFIPSEKEMHYFGQFKNQKCAKAILSKFFGSFFFEHVLTFLKQIKDKHGEALKRFYDYLENTESEIHEKDTRNLKAYKSHEYLKLFIISDFIVSSYLSNLKLSEEEKKAYEDLRGYYNLVIRSINFSSDVVELFSSKVFEDIIKEINSYLYLVKDNLTNSDLKSEDNENVKMDGVKNEIGIINQEIESILNQEIVDLNKKKKDQKININYIKNHKKQKENKDQAEILKINNNNINTKNKDKINLENVVRKLILVSSHDTHISANLWFLGINANSHDYNYNDELTLILHFEDNELFLEIKYNDISVKPDFCEKHPKMPNICLFDQYIDFIKKRIHRDELLNDFCNEAIDKFPAYLERESHLKDDL